MKKKTIYWIVGIIGVYFLIIEIRKRKCNNTTGKQWHGAILFPPFGLCNDFMPTE